MIGVVLYLNAADIDGLVEIHHIIAVESKLHPVVVQPNLSYQRFAVVIQGNLPVVIMHPSELPFTPDSKSERMPGAMVRPTDAWVVQVSQVVARIKIN